MSTPVAGPLATVPLHVAAGDIAVWWNDPGGTWESVPFVTGGPYLPLAGGSLSGALSVTGNFSASGNITQGGNYLYFNGATGTVNGTGGPFIYADGNIILHLAGAGGFQLQDGSGNTQLVVNNTGQVSATGYKVRAGSSGAYGGNVFNIEWTGAPVMWIDTTNVGTITVTCDYRIKENVAELPSTWDRVKALRPISYTLKDYGQLHKADPAERWGFIAHELQETLLPSAATGYKDAPNLVQSPDLMALIASLTNALQEAMQRIEALEMIKWLALIGLLAFASSARADMYPDGSNAKLPVTSAQAKAACVNNAGAIVSVIGGCLFDVRQYGADQTGASDSADAFNSCLTAASGGTCFAGFGAYKLLKNITIPANTTLKCGDNVPDQQNTPAAYGTAPRLMLDSAHSIVDGGQAAKLTGCLIVRNGIVFPVAPDTSGYVGNGVLSSFGSFQLTNTIIIGFDTCAEFTSLRPLVDTVYVDCNGATHPALWFNNGNFDSGYGTRIKLQQLGTFAGGVSCAGQTRPGIGLENDGINYFGEVTALNFRGIQIHNTSYMPADKLWSDFPTACGPAYPGSIGIQNDGNMTTGEMNLNATGYGLVVNGNTTVSHLFLNSILGPCVVLGNAAPGNLFVQTIETNPAPGSPDKSCGTGGSGQAIIYNDPTHASSLTISSGMIKNIASTPYISVPSNVSANLINISDRIITDLANPSTLWGAATTVGSCTGIGTGTCALGISKQTTPWRGIVNLTTVGATGGTGEVVLTFPAQADDAFPCFVTAGTGPWGNATFSTAGSGNALHVAWSNGGVGLPTSNTYSFSFQCDAQ